MTPETYFTLTAPTPGVTVQSAYHAQRSGPGLLATMLPLELSVTSELRNKLYPGKCECQTVYRLTTESIAYLRRHGALKMGLTPSRRPCVCLCMGKLSDGLTE